MTRTKESNQKHEEAQLSPVIPFGARTTLKLLLREGDQGLKHSRTKGIKSNQVESLRQKKKPSKKQLAWGLASHLYRQREKVGLRLYKIAWKEALVDGALIVLFPSRTDLANHQVRESLLADVVEKYLHRVIDDCSDGDLKVDIQRMLRDFDK